MAIAPLTPPPPRANEIAQGDKTPANIQYYGWFIKLQKVINALIAAGGGGGGVTTISLNDTSTVPIYTTAPTAATAGAVAETIQLKTQAANLVFAGPGSGAAAQPTFRALVASDISSIISAANITPDTHPNPELSVNDEFEFGSSLDLTGARFPGATGWTWSRQGNSSTTIGAGSLLFQGDFNGSGGLTNFFQPTSGATWSYTAKIAAANCFNSSVGGGMYLCNSVGGKILFFGFIQVLTGAVSAQCYQYAGTATGSQGAVLNSAGNISTPFGTTVAGVTRVASGWIYMQVAYDGTNITCAVSPTGIPGSYQLLVTQLPATFLAGVPNQVGLAIQTGNQFNLTQVSQLACDWFRKTA